jgi:DNA-binding NtrC family response regulator
MNTANREPLPLALNGADHARVLLIDDSDQMRRLLRGYLAALGTREVQSTEYVEEAYRLLRQGWPELIITDLKMTPVNGFEFIKAVRANDSDIPIMVITGYADVPTVERLMLFGATKVLVKPVSLTMLQTQILPLLSLIRAQRRAKTSRAWEQASIET